MRKDVIEFRELLRLLDRYAMHVECQGDSQQFAATHIYTTSSVFVQRKFLILEKTSCNGHDVFTIQQLNTRMEIIFAHKINGLLPETIEKGLREAQPLKAFNA